MDFLTDAALSAHCQRLAHPSPSTVGLAAVLVVGLVCSYLPQHIKIIQHRTSEGLSPWWVLLGGLSSSMALGNILTLPASRADMSCCNEVSGGACAAALLGIVQIGCQWACFMFIVLLFLIFFPSATDFDLSASTASHHHSTPPPRRRDAIIVASTTVLALLTIGIVSLALVAAWPSHTQAWANLLGIIAGILSAIQYLPQIWYTYHLRDIASLSVTTMLIQVPGSFLFAFSLYQRVGWEGWSTWLVYCVSGVLQGALLGIAISYYIANKNAANKLEGDGDSIRPVDDVDGGADADERTALLRNGHSVKGRPIAGTHRSNASQRQLGKLYAATPPEHDSDRSA
ncbi:hypothetical protein LTR36_005449 [Oleoguttula mirabilis]|uniref:PQ loop repeat protein n=1 Tax=Oleoguttula mirabilis TaxID=1507867 RepID=A0AAV9JEB5_9PEZI|nr:hypothetical protein LTR36_005449 [Oleoguttula mirabilis]